MAKNLIIIKKGDGTTAMDITNKALIAKPELAIPSVTAQFFNTEATEVVEGRILFKHERAIDMTDSADHKAGISAADEESKLDKEDVEFDGYSYSKLIYNKKIDARVWEGEGKIVNDLASLAMGKKQKTATSYYTQMIAKVKAMNTINGTTGAVTTVDTTFKGKDGNKYMSPVLVKQAVAVTDEASAFKLVSQIFKDIDEIRETGMAGTADENHPHMRGFGGQLAVAVKNETALALAQLNIFQETGKAQTLIQNGLAGMINGVAFVVDPQLDKKLTYMITPLGSEAPMYVPDRHKFSSTLKDHPDFAEDFWRLTVSASNGTVANTSRMCLVRLSAKDIKTL